MKTTNNVQKTNLKMMVAAGLTVLGFFADAQGALKHDFDFKEINQLAFATAKHVSATNATTTGAAFAGYLEPAAEEALAVEPWMTEEKNFTGFAAMLEPAAEKELTVESWMMDEKKFNEREIKRAMNRKSDVVITGATFTYREVLEEEELKVQKWMTSPKVWNR
jgi:hypothetical protein